MVSHAFGYVILIYPYPCQKRSSSSAKRSISGASNLGSSTTDRSSSLRQGLKHYNVSAQVQDIMLTSWSASTIEQYNTPIRRWVSYCNEHNIDPLGASVQEGAEFLAHLFVTSELGYSAMNSARSALSALLKPTDGVSFGKHPMISRLLKGMFRQRPALPKYTVTYDASEVISFMASDAKLRDFGNAFI